MIRQESQFQKLAYNPRTQASGLMQLIPATAREMGAKDIFDPQQNIEAGTKYLAYLLERYNNNVKLALAAYNAGMGNVDKDLKAGGDGIPNFPETQAYVPNVLSYQKQYDKMVKEDGQIQFVSGGVDNYPYKTANTSGADRWGFYIRQCTSFVAWRLNEAGIPFHNTMKGGRFGNAENWADNARRLGYTVNNKPAVGAVAQWNAGAFGHSGYGHVAYVTAVDGSKITIEEYNYKQFSYSRRTLPASQVSNYIHFQ
ncbi:Soluble lytic murein transglycosylase precursor [Mycobacterium tuberculosis]|nr:Soluble lytic murein transglycosylase precursor [Mycobacterium tuberculosis]